MSLMIRAMFFEESRRAATGEGSALRAGLYAGRAARSLCLGGLSAVAFGAAFAAALVVVLVFFSQEGCRGAPRCRACASWARLPSQRQRRASLGLEQVLQQRRAPPAPLPFPSPPPRGPEGPGASSGRAPRPLSRWGPSEQRVRRWEPSAAAQLGPWAAAQRGPWAVAQLGPSAAAQLGPLPAPPVQEASSRAASSRGGCMGPSSAAACWPVFRAGAALGPAWLLGLWLLGAALGSPVAGLSARGPRSGCLLAPLRRAPPWLLQLAPPWLLLLLAPPWLLLQVRLALPCRCCCWRRPAHVSRPGGSAACSGPAWK